jgi:hypothetical protein
LVKTVSAQLQSLVAHGLHLFARRPGYLPDVHTAFKGGGSLTAETPMASKGAPMMADSKPLPRHAGGHTLHLPEEL